MSYRIKGQNDEDVQKDKGYVNGKRETNRYKMGEEERERLTDIDTRTDRMRSRTTWWREAK